VEDSRSSAERWNERYSDVDRLWSRKPNALLAGFVEGLEPGSAVDIGAGEGRNSVWLAQAGWKVTAVDVSDVGLARAERHAAEEGVEIECVVADWRSYRAPGAFDLAVISFMHPLPDERAGMFAHAGEMLRPGGHLFTVGVEIGELGRRGPKDPERLYTPERLREALVGFEVVRCERVAYRGETTDGPRPVVDCVAIGRLPGGEAG
jgi:2-polyprenyl-3-methyl-5-hydroxy-6-metoxy-1,4-benzoquinol methylase